MPQKKSENKKKRNVKSKPKKPPAKKETYRGPDIGKILAVVAAAAFGIAGYFMVTDSGNTYTVAKVQDMEDDDFDDSIPLFSDGELIMTIPEDEIVIVDTDADVSEGNYQIMTIGPDGDLIEGITPKDYIDMEHSLKLDEDDDRLKYTYEVTGADVVNLRDSTLFEPSSVIGTINEGDLVIGGDRVVAKDNDFMWIPVIYIDEEGNLAKAFIGNDYLTMLGEIDLVKEDTDTKTMKVHTDGGDLNLRSETELDESNIIVTIPNNSIVIKLPEKEKVANSYKWTKIRYTDSEGNTFEGYVVDNYIREAELVKMRVDTATDGKLNLNVRKEPSISSEKVASIEHDTVIEVPEEYIDNRVHDEENHREWMRVDLKDGTFGYVDYSYLKREKTKEKEDKSIEVEGMLNQKELDEIFEKMSVRSTGNVVGIDSVAYTPEQLEELLTSKNAIPSEVYYQGSDRYDTADIQGKVDFVLISVGARGWGKAGNMVDSGDKYKKLAEVCEKHKIPYGFYFYSTALTFEEADEEINYCRNAINSIEDRKYNLLPLVADFETHVERDADGNVIAQSRLIGNDITDNAAYWLNQSEKYFGKTMIYIAPRNMTEGGYDYIINLERLNEKVHSGKPDFWIPAMRYSNDYTKIQGQKYLDPLENNMDIKIIQTILDSNNKESGLPKVDINIATKENIREIIEKRWKEQMDQYLGIDSKSDKKLATTIGKDRDWQL